MYKGYSASELLLRVSELLCPEHCNPYETCLWQAVPAPEAAITPFPSRQATSLLQLPGEE